MPEDGCDPTRVGGISYPEGAVIYPPEALATGQSAHDAWAYRPNPGAGPGGWRV